jgi:hypothetical protein
MDIDERKGWPRTHVKKGGLDMWSEAMSNLKVTPASGGSDDHPSRVVAVDTRSAVEDMKRAHRSLHMNYVEVGTLIRMMTIAG